MTAGQLVAVGFLALMVALILWNIRGHRRSGDASDTGGMDNTGADGAAD